MFDAHRLRNLKSLFRHSLWEEAKEDLHMVRYTAIVLANRVSMTITLNFLSIDFHQLFSQSRLSGAREATGQRNRQTWPRSRGSGLDVGLNRKLLRRAFLSGLGDATVENLGQF